MPLQRAKVLKGLVASLTLATVLVGCQSTPPNWPAETEAVQTSVAGQVFATLTAQSPSPTPIPAPTPTSTPVPYNVYFGDLHLHTSRIHIKEAFQEEFSRAVLRLTNLHARRMAHHDFVAITNHAYLLEDWMWEVTLEVADEFTEDGVFVSFPAFEWTASNYCGEFCTPARPDYRDWGHRNVYFRSSEVATALLRCTDPDYDSPEELFSALPAPDLATTIPHTTASASHPFDWSRLNPDYDRVVEIVQHTGDHEADVVESGWSAGRILGVVAGSDNHFAAAGTRKGSPRYWLPS